MRDPAVVALEEVYLLALGNVRPYRKSREYGDKWIAMLHDWHQMTKANAFDRVRGVRLEKRRRRQLLMKNITNEALALYVRCHDCSQDGAPQT